MKKYLLIIALLLLCYSCDDNPTDDGGWCPDIVFRPLYDSLVWHPNGELIGFNYMPLTGITFPYGEYCPGKATYNVDSLGFWLINVDGTNMRRVLPFWLVCPSWSPDGDWLAFSYGAQICKMRFTGEGFDTTNIVQLTFEGSNFFPAWSPDGEWLAFDSDVNGSNGAKAIWKMRSDGSQKTDLSIHGIGEWRMPKLVA